MPIDLTAVAGRFAAVFAGQLRDATAAQKSIEKALARRREAARAAGRATGQLPIFAFHDSALVLHLADDQRGALLVGTAEPSLGDHLTGGAARLVTGLARATEPFRGDSQETVVPRFVTSVDAALSDVDEAMRRFAVPHPQMFAPARRPGTDLFGVAALGLRALVQAATTTGEIRRLTEEIRATLPLPAPQAPTAPQMPQRGPDETLDAVAFELLGATVLIGAAPGLVDVLPGTTDVLLRHTVLLLRSWVLDLLVAGEAKVLALRGDAIEFTVAKPARMGGQGMAMLGGALGVIGAHVTLSAAVYRSVGAGLAVAIGDFVVLLGRFLTGLVDLMRAVPDLLRAVTAFDMARLPLVHLSLDDVLDADGRAVNTALRDKLLAALLVAEGIAVGASADQPLLVTLRPLAPRIDAARRLVAALFDSGQPVTLPEAAPLRFHSDFPDLGGALFGEGRREQLLAVVETFHGAVRTHVAASLGRTREGLNLTAGAVSEAMRDGWPGTADRVRSATEQAIALTDRLLGPEQNTQPGPLDAVARAFESWLATGGILLVGEAIPAYVGELAAQWRARLAEGSELTAPLTPTSPHILRKRAVLGRVAVPRVTLRLPPGRELDDTLAQKIAGQFADAVRGAYRTGANRLRELAEQKGP
ncbi:hypothetical protein [Streptomyces melanogenes]|uniref:hypothetical protein n=1 Tax=Streptomyces melanogenes TaxID=67326 RepID=UPI00379A4D1D